MICWLIFLQGTASNMRKPGKKGKKMQNREDEWQGKNLLSPQPTYVDDDDYEDHLKDCDIPLKADDFYRFNSSRRSSMRGKYSLAHSRESQLESTLIDFEDNEPRYDIPRVFRSPPPNMPMSHRGRSRSGVWDSNKNKSPAKTERRLTQEKRLITMSAPDLLECLSDSDSSSSGYGGSNSIYARVPWGGGRGDSLRGRPEPPPRDKRCSTLGATPYSHRTVHMQLSRSNSRNKIRC